jgi:hypothetical protein
MPSQAASLTGLSDEEIKNIMMIKIEGNKVRHRTREIILENEGNRQKMAWREE